MLLSGSGGGRTHVIGPLGTSEMFVSFTWLKFGDFWLKLELVFSESTQVIEFSGYS